MSTRQKLKRVLVSIVLLAILITLLITPANVGAFDSDGQKCATLSLLKGEGAGVTAGYLAKTSTRLQSAIISLRLSGKEAGALVFTGAANFTDAGKVDWQGGRNILAYLKANPQFGWIGSPDGSFKPDEKIDAQAMHKVLLEILGYKQGIDFTWEKVISFARSLGFNKTVGASTFTNSNIASALMEALNLKSISSQIKLVDALLSSGIIGPAAVAAAGFIPARIQLRFMLFGEKPNFMDEVLTEFKKRTKNTLNTELLIDWSPLADHKQKVQLKLAAGEEVDCVFDASFATLLPLLAKGAYIQLDKYFFNDKYPGLKKAFSEVVINNNKNNDHVYTIPFARYFGGIDGIFIRKDLREKYGLPKINSNEELETFYKMVLKNEKGMIPLSVEGRRGFYQLFVYPTVDRFRANITSSSVGGNILFEIAVSKDTENILGMVTLGDPDENYAQFPSPFNKSYNDKEYILKRDWNKYLEKDAINQTDKVGLFASGKAASVEWTYSTFSDIENKLKANNPGAQLEFYAYEESVRNMQPGGIVTTYNAGNSVCIPVTSKKADRTMAFFDWLYSDRANHDLFELGIEGKHWTAVGNDKYTIPKNLTYIYNFPGYELTWNPTMIRISADLNQDITKYYYYLARSDTFVRDVRAGFTFDASNVKNEIAKVGLIYTDTRKLINLGLYENPVAEAKKANEKMRSLGLEKIRQELKTQFQKFLDNRK